MEFSRQESWSGLPFPVQGIFQTWGSILSLIGEEPQRLLQDASTLIRDWRARAGAHPLPILSPRSPSPRLTPSLNGDIAQHSPEEAQPSS